MKIALVHDYIKEFGGAERVLRVLADIYPRAPIFTSFRVEGSSCDKEFSDKVIVESKWAFLLKYFNMYSPLRFLAPLVWRSFDLSEYDLVITSTSSFFARGFKVGPKTKVVAYCHTPPRFLYGYEMSINLQKYFVVRIYSVIVNHFLRLFDYWSAQKINHWIVNSKNVQKRVWKFYRKESSVIYPPVNVKMMELHSGSKKENYYLIVSRLVGAKGLLEAAQATNKLGVRLKIVGESVGLSSMKKRLLQMENVELVGRVKDEDLSWLYARARGFLALARDEDFGITPVESMAAGTPVIAFDGGGFKETVVGGKTGVFVKGTDTKSLAEAIRKVEKTDWKAKELHNQANKFSEDRFKKEFLYYIRRVLKENA